MVTHIEALFPTADDALSASVHLRTIDGVKEIRTERRSTESENDQHLYLAGTLAANPGNVTASTFNSGTPISPIGAVAFNDLIDADGKASRNHEMVLSCIADDERAEEVIAAVRNAGGTIVAG